MTDLGHDQPDATVELARLAGALAQQGYDATLITPAPYLAVCIPGALVPQMVYNTGGHFWWQSAQVIAPGGQVRLAAEVITGALRAHPHDPPTHDASSPSAVSSGGQHSRGRGGSQEC